MLNWIRSYSEGMLTASFVLGAACAALFVALSNSANARLLAMGGLVCAGALVTTLLARFAVWCARRLMPESLLPMRWHELSNEQFHDIGIAARIAFVSQHLGLFAAVFGFGWLLSTMCFVIFRGN